MDDNSWLKKKGMHHQDAALFGGFIYSFKLKPLTAPEVSLRERHRKTIVWPLQENHCVALSSQECPPVFPSDPFSRGQAPLCSSRTATLKCSSSIIFFGSRTLFTGSFFSKRFLSWCFRVAGVHGPFVLPPQNSQVSARSSCRRLG